MSKRNPTRRNVLAGIGASVTLATTTAAVLSTAAQPAPVDPIGNFLDASPDAELIALGEKFDCLWTAEREADRVATLAYRSGDPDQDRLADLHDKAVDATSAVVHRIAEADAKTMEGVNVKLRAFSWCYCDDLDEMRGEMIHDTTDERLSRGIARSMLLMARQGV